MWLSIIEVRYICVKTKRCFCSHDRVSLCNRNSCGWFEVISQRARSLGWDTGSNNWESRSRHMLGVWYLSRKPTVEFNFQWWHLLNSGQKKLVREKLTEVPLEFSKSNKSSEVFWFNQKGLIAENVLSMPVAHHLKICDLSLSVVDAQKKYTFEHFELKQYDYTSDSISWLYNKPITWSWWAGPVRAKGRVNYDAIGLK